MRAFSVGLIALALLFNLVSLHSVSAQSSASYVEDQVPEKIVRAYHRIIRLDPLVSLSDWQTMVSYFNDYRNQALIQLDIEVLIEQAKQQQLRDILIDLYRWKYQHHLFNFEYNEAVKLLTNIASIETRLNLGHRSWALSRIGLYHWLMGNEAQAMAYASMSDEGSGNTEIWFQQFKLALEEQKGPYKHLYSVLNKGKEQIELEMLSIPAGEWLSLSFMLKREIILSDSYQASFDAFALIQRYLPDAGTKGLEPYMVQLAASQSWNLGSIAADEYPILKETIKWQRNFTLAQEDWNRKLKQLDAESELKSAKMSAWDWIDFNDSKNLLLFGFVGLLLLALIILSIRAMIRRDKNDEVVTSDFEEPTIAQTKAAESIVEKSSEKETKDVMDAFQTIDNEWENAHQEKSEFEATSEQIERSVFLASDSKSVVHKNEKDPLFLAQEKKADQETFQRFLETLNELAEIENFDEVWKLIESYCIRNKSGWLEFIRWKAFELSEKDIQYLTMMMLGFDDEQMAYYAGIKHKTVLNAKARIKRRASLDEDIDPLAHFVGLWEESKST